MCGGSGSDQVADTLTLLLGDGSTAATTVS